MSFDRAVAYVIEREGGDKITDDPSDPGGLTKWGISKRAFPSTDIANLTREQAEDIYRRYYWDKVSGSQLPDPISFVMFDCAVNMGVGVAIRTAQAVCGLKEDGVIGPITLAALKAQNRPTFVERFQAERLLRYASLKTWNIYKKGWTRRLIRTAMDAIL